MKCVKDDGTEIMALKNFPITSSVVPISHPKAGSAGLLTQKHDLPCASALTQTKPLGKPTDLKGFAMPCIVSAIEKRTKFQSQCSEVAECVPVCLSRCQHLNKYHVPSQNLAGKHSHQT